MVSHSKMRRKAKSYYETMSRFFALVSALFFSMLTLGLLGGGYACAQVATNVEIIDPDDILSESEEQDLSAYTEQAPLPEPITTVTFIVLRHANEPFNDFIVNYLKTNRPNLLNATQDKFADGSVTFALATESRLVGTNVSDDVNDVIHLLDNPDRFADEMKPALRDGNWIAGLKTGVDVVAAGPEEPGSTIIPIAIISTLGIGTLGGLSAAIAATRKKNRATTDEQYDFISQNYGRLAQELTRIDVQANNLNNPLVDAELRSQWEDIRDDFLAIHEDMMNLPEFDGLKDKTLYKHAKKIAAIHEKVEQVVAAEKNLETLHKLETGDIATRRNQLEDIRSDILSGSLNIEKPAHREAMTALQNRCDALFHQLESPQFISDYARLIKDYQTILTHVREEQFTHVPETTHAPALGSSDWRPGYGYNGYVPYMVMHTMNQEAQASVSSSSSSNSTTFSGGFSGAGVSGRF